MAFVLLVNAELASGGGGSEKGREKSGGGWLHTLLKPDQH